MLATLVESLLPLLCGRARKRRQDVMAEFVAAVERRAAAGAQQAAAAPAPATCDLLAPVLPPQLELRRAQALALRVSCARFECPHLGGACEAELRGKRCKQCRRQRNCSEACLRAEWPRHRAGCRLLTEGGGE